MSRRGAVGRAINNKHLAEERPGSIPGYRIINNFSIVKKKSKN